ncbi:anthranilate phosphoribosyltransferase [Alteromonas aestuariivivens]|uniref:Anthranilate phosphoribosyltransferase n=1 Tax=Alteromonas aestuariivivens TaxID=1938339 RepID=A0A3D8M3H7_9ALTE|nr:anthranilate phosphoribosyltransferase [Alteromonas aestuariivivens]RDV24283.1 anthranilate phosphoribosyltransferase [Alteromonas aestuariivivens]
MYDAHAVLEQLFSAGDLSQTQAFGLFNSIMHGEQPESVIAAVLTALKIKGETPNEIAGAASAMVSNALPFPRPDYPFADIVGTGGDGHNTINISSAAAVVSASCGVKVAKHGNRSVSSKSGSADLFKTFGIKLDISPQTARKCLDEANFCFLFAPVYHAGMRHAAPVRAALKTRTLFNVLGPLANPAGPTHGVFGVYSPKLLEAYANTLMLLGQHRAMIVHGSGLDELALHGESQVFDLEHGDIRKLTVTPADFGLPSYPLSAIEGGEPEDNRKMIEAALAGEGQEAHRMAIAMNAGALLTVTGKADTFRQGAEMAIASMEASKPLDTLKHVGKLAQEETANG